ncbi:MAG: MBL fold metallo-hydrolase [Pseudomonadota bacterium]
MSETSDYVALLGVKGGPSLRPGSNMPTSSLVSIGGRNIVIDAGLGVTRGLCDQEVDLREIDAVFITHLHSDHYLELGPLIHTAWTSGLDRSMSIFGPPGIEKYWRYFMTSMRADIRLRIADEGRYDLGKLIDIHVIDEGMIFEQDGLMASAMRNHHPPIEDSFAYRFETDSSTICFSGDTTYIDKMVDFAEDADLLIHEVMLTEAIDAIMERQTNGDDRLREHILKSHSTAEEAGRVAQAAGVKGLALNHYIPDGIPGFDDVDWIQAVRRSWAGPLIIGKDGLRIEL